MPVLEEGTEALRAFSARNGLNFDDQDLKYYTWLFCEDLKRNPTTVELFDLAQGNSEHSRHWFFGGKMVIDGKAAPATLFELVKRPHKTLPNSNSTIAFHDNSSAQRGSVANMLLPQQAAGPTPFVAAQRDLDVTLTVETHNFPCGIAPLPGLDKIIIFFHFYFSVWHNYFGCHTSF